MSQFPGSNNQIFCAGPCSIFYSEHQYADTQMQGLTCLIIHSGAGNTDQLSVKDSGKGDSDFNDSDSDISGDGLRRTLSTFQPWAKGKIETVQTHRYPRVIITDLPSGD